MATLKLATAKKLLLEVRIMHSRFSISLIMNESSTCNILQESFKVKLMIKTKLIIWDKVLKADRYCFEALD